jgi:hypothetical protein
VVVGERIEAASGASVSLCRACAVPFYTRGAGRTCDACSSTARHVCPACGHTWQGRGAGVAGDACPLLGCPGRV